MRTADVSFAGQLRAFRRSAGLTQEQLAESAGMSVHGVQKLERGLTHPYRDTAQRLALALRLDEADAGRFFAMVQPIRRSVSAPPKNELDSRKHNLPLPATSFVGRDRELAEIVDQLARTRVLTLTGAGGSGKTRLALETARRSLPDFADGVWLIELASLLQSDLVPYQVPTVLEVRPTSQVAAQNAVGLDKTSSDVCAQERGRHFQG